MMKKLIKHGNSHAIVIDKSIMDAMGIAPDSELQITLSGSTLSIAPVNVGATPEQIQAAIQDLRPKYHSMLRNLAK